MIAFASHMNISKKGIAQTGQTRPVVFAMGDIDVSDSMFMAGVIAISYKKAPGLGIASSGFFGEIMHHSTQGVRPVTYRRGTINDFGTREGKRVNRNGIMQMPRTIDGIVHTYPIHYN